MIRSGPRILLIGGTYRALCVLERLLERGSRVVAFIGVEGGGERDFCPEILEVCDRASIPARSGHKLGEEIVRWLEDRIRPELAIAVGLRGDVPVAIGGNCRLGLAQISDMLQESGCPGVTLRQRGKRVEELTLADPGETEESADTYMRVIDASVDVIDRFLDELDPRDAEPAQTVPFFRRELPCLDPASLRDDTPGSNTTSLEREVAERLGAERVLALDSPREAFELLYRGIGLERGSAAVCPGVVSSAAVGGLHELGVRASFGDVDPDRLTLQTERVAELITPATRALIVSHALGQPAELDVLYGIAQERRLELIEDAGESLGARFGDSYIGRSPCTCVFRVPLVRAGQRGDAALVTLPAGLAERVEPHAKGLRLGDVAAAAVREELEGLDARVAARRRNASRYGAELARYDAFRVPATPEDAISAYAGYLLRITRYARTTADDLHKLLGESGIETRRLALPLRERDLAGLPATESARATGLLLPIDEGLDPAHQDRLLDAIFGYAIG